MTLSRIGVRGSAGGAAGRARKRAVAAVPATAAAASVALALGLGGVPSAALGVSRNVLHGSVTAAGKPLRGAAVALFAGSRGRVRELGSTRTDAAGSFAITYARPADGVVYVEATLMAQPRLRLRSVVGIGAGGGVPQRTAGTVVVNERTTVATSYALAQFTGPGGITGPAPGLQNAAATALNLADPTTGEPGPALAGDQANHQALATLNTLANLMFGDADPEARVRRRQPHQFEALLFDVMVPPVLHRWLQASVMLPQTPQTRTRSAGTKPSES